MDGWEGGATVTGRVVSAGLGLGVVAMEMGR